MRKVRPGLFGNFVPLDRALEAVASRISLSNEELDAWRGINDDAVSDDEVQANIQRWPIRRILSTSRAASAILPLLNRPQSERPGWIELISGGFQLRDEGVAREGLILLSQVEQQNRFLIASRPQRFEKTSSPPPAWAEGEIPRISSIGFDKDELITFLNKHGILHSLGDPLNGDATARARIFSFRGDIAEVVRLAIEQAVDPSRYQSAFAKLREFACSEKPPYPLLGYNAQDKEVLWGEPNDPSAFTLEHMRGRYRKSRKQDSSD